MNALAQLSIFTDVDIDALPVKPVRTKRPFSVQDLPSLSAEIIKNRIDQLVRQEGSATGSAQDEVRRTLTGTDTTKETKANAINRMLNVPMATAPLFFTSTFTPLQEWEGYVREIWPESISADLVDLTAGGARISQAAEIPLEELSDTDRDKLRIGGIFRWSIGYQRTSRGTKMRVSNIVFRDLPRWTQRDLREAKEEAAALEDYFKSGRPDLSRAVDSPKA
jgi:hypothetical protein